MSKPAGADETARIGEPFSPLHDEACKEEAPEPVPNGSIVAEVNGETITVRTGPAVSDSEKYGEGDPGVELT